MCTDCNTLFIYNFLQGALLKTLKDALHCTHVPLNQTLKRVLMVSFEQYHRQISAVTDMFG